MPQKKNAVQMWLDRGVIAKVDTKLAAEHSRMARTEAVEQVLDDWADGRIVRADSVSTPKLFMTMFAMGLMDQKRLDELLALVRAGVLSPTVPEDKFGIKVERSPRTEK